MLNELLTKLQQKYSKNPLFQKDGFLAPADEKNVPQKIKLPLFRLLFSPFNQILDNGKIFFTLTLLSALAICLSATSLGFGYLCTYPAVQALGTICSSSLENYIFYNLIKVLVLGYVGVKWSEYIFEGVTFNLKTLLSVDKKYLKFSFSLLLIFLLNMLPLLSWWILYMRVPNPDWRVEMIFFAVVSIGFVIPLLLFRIYWFLGFVLRGKKIPPMAEIWRKTDGNSLKIFLSFMLILVLGMFIFGNLYTNFRVLADNVSLYNILMSEYICDFFVLFLFVSILNNINFQYMILYTSDNNEEEKHARD